jgi:lysophospholipase L1-like esterase
MGRKLWPPLAAFLFLSSLVLASPPASAEAPATRSPVYVALGDSLAFGVGAANPAAQGYVAVAYDGLLRSDRYRDRGLELINLSVPGATSSDLLQPDGQIDQALRIVESRQAAANAGPVEIVTIDVGGNDLLALARPGSPCFDDPAGAECSQQFGNVLGSLRTNLTEILSRLRQATLEAEIYVIDLYNPFSGTGDAIEPIADVGVQQLNAVIASVTADPALGATLVSVFDAFRGRGTQWIAPDGIHPNTEGHAIIGELLLAAIEGRDPEIPRDISNEPLNAGDSAPGGVADDGPAEPQRNDTLIALAIAVPLAFLAGIALSAVYFLARGRA